MRPDLGPDARILVLSDIHANIDALEAIDEPHDAVLFLGDIVDYGPAPAECIGRLRAEQNLLRVRGNHDNAVAFHVPCGCGPAYRHLSNETREQMWRLLGEEELAWIGAPSTRLELQSGALRVLAVHAAPSDDLYKYLTPELSDQELAGEAALTDADVILVGHTHQSFLRRAGGKLIANVGSVGQPRDGVPQVSYAILEGGRVELRRAGYDVEAAVARLTRLPLSDRALEELSYILRHAGMP